MKYKIPKNQKGGTTPENKNWLKQPEPKRDWLVDWTKKNFPKAAAYGELFGNLPNGINPIKVIQTAGDFTGLPGLVNSIAGNPMNLPAHEVEASMVPMIGGLNNIKGLVPQVETKVPGLLSKASSLIKKYVGKSEIPTVSNIDLLNHLKSSYSKYGYEIPENLEEIAKSDDATNELVKKLVDQHNTFVRGVSTNWGVLEQKNPEILRHLEGAGIDWKNNPQQAAEYMATHIPINTGYGRASLDKKVFKEGLDGLYTSNSLPTAEGYTYGDGFVVKVKRPTDYSSTNRLDWINKNNLDYFEHKIPTITKKRRGFSDKVKIDNTKNILKTSHENQRLLDNIGAIQVDLQSKGIDFNEYNSISEGNVLTNPKFKHLLPYAQGKDNSPEGMQELINAVNSDIIKRYNQQFPPERYAHYIHLGTPGEKVLEPIESIRITPEIWKNKSRAHTNVYTKGLTAGSILGTYLGLNNKDNVESQKRGGKLIPKNQAGSKIDRLKRQAFAESSLDPSKVSPTGAMGPLQIMPNAYKDYQAATGDPTPFEKVKDFRHAIKVRNWLVDNIADADFIKGKPQTDVVKLAKIYGSYNWGKSNMANYLNGVKDKLDIYKSTGWIQGLPPETRDYLNKIILGKNPQFEKEYNNAIKTNPNSKYLNR